jgi:uncharacterized damage-inducible protein DinB
MLPSAVTQLVEKTGEERSMDLQTVVTNALTLNTNNFVKPALEGLSDADLTKRPTDQCNSIAWLLWHQTRVEDAFLSNISGKPQAWIDGKWHEKFGMPANPGDVGVGNTLEQVAAFKPTKAALLGYADAVRNKTLEVLKSLPAADLDRDMPGPGGATRKVGDTLGILMIDHFHHSGQIAYVRGYLTGKGWFAR